MNVNITFFIQLCNVAITIWVLRRALWPHLLKVIEAEDKAVATLQHTTEELSSALQCADENQINKETLLAQTIHKALDDLEAQYTPEEQPIKSIPTATQEPKPSISSSIVYSKNLVSLLQQKF